MSLTSDLGKVMEQLKYVIRKDQNGFSKGKSCLTNLIALCNRITCLADVWQTVDTVYLDFSKAFGMVSYSLVLEKLMCYGSGQVVCVVGGELTGRSTLQEDLGRLKEWASKSLKNFNKDKCKILHMEKHNTGV